MQGLLLKRMYKKAVLKFSTATLKTGRWISGFSMSGYAQLRIGNGRLNFFHAPGAYRYQP